jgi:hypothetical protein
MNQNMTMLIVLRLIIISIFLSNCAPCIFWDNAVVDLKGAKFTYDPTLWEIVSRRDSKAELKYLHIPENEDVKVYVECFNIHGKDITSIVQYNLKLFTEHYDNVTYRKASISGKETHRFDYDILSDNNSFEMYIFEREGIVFSVVFYANKQPFQNVRERFSSFVENM